MTAEAPAASAKKRTGWGRRVALALLALLVVLLAVVIGALLWFNVLGNAVNLAAKSVCSAAFVAGREADADVLMEQDVLPASFVLNAVSTEIDVGQKQVDSSMLLFWNGSAALVSDRGCVIGAEPDPTAEPFTAAPDPATWPAGDAPVPQSEWPAGVDAEALDAVVADALVGSGDTTAANARGIAVVHDGELLVAEDGVDIQPGQALHGWSMTKTVNAMLAYTKLQEMGVDIETPVVDAFPADREPEWVADWREDDRAEITIADLMFMTPGLALDEGYGPLSSVVQMLYGEADMAAFAAANETDHAPGTYWEYLSATSNILAAVLRGQFPTDEEYWAYAEDALYEPIGVDTATLETDLAGTGVGSSYLWASTGDWARFGELMLNDGEWEGEQVMPPGWLDLASTNAVSDGDGSGYGAQTWKPADPVGGECKSVDGIPEDTVSMEGHWGQLVAMVPSRDTVIVRLGWTFEDDVFDSCQLMSDVLAALPQG